MYQIIIKNKKSSIIKHINRDKKTGEIMKPLYEDDYWDIEIGSSAESVGSLGCRQVAKPMIQGYF